MIRIILIVLFVILVFCYIKFRYVNTHIIKQFFNRLSLFIVGKRGKGKDTLYSFLVFGKENNSNCPYNDKTNIITIKDIILPDDIDRHSLETGNFNKVDYAKYSFLNNPTIISDAQINLPNWEDSILKKEYYNLPLTYQVWRHLYDSGLHFNTQLFSRLWKIMREQIEDCIKCLYCVRLPLFTFIKVRYYENADDCEKNLKPLKTPLLRLVKDDVVRVENSKRGIIKDYILMIPNRMITHDSRFYRHKIFTEESLLLYDNAKKLDPKKRRFKK